MNRDEDPHPLFLTSNVEEWLMMTFVLENCLLDLFVVLDLDLGSILIDIYFFVSQNLEINIIYFICFDNSIKRVIQCTCVDLCENTQSKDMYAKCPKIQSTYFVNRDIAV